MLKTPNIYYCARRITVAFTHTLKYSAAVVFCRSHWALNSGRHQRVKGEPFILYFVDHAFSYKFLEITNLTHFFMYLFNVSTCFKRTALIIRRSNCINTSSGMISLCKWLLGMPDRHTKQSLTQTNHTRWCINTIWSPDDERCDARNM